MILNDAVIGGRGIHSWLLFGFVTLLPLAQRSVGCGCAVRASPVVFQKDSMWNSTHVLRTRSTLVLE
jgi:hypothetical protein